MSACQKRGTPEWPFGGRFRDDPLPGSAEFRVTGECAFTTINSIELVMWKIIGIIDLPTWLNRFGGKMVASRFRWDSDGLDWVASPAIPYSYRLDVGPEMIWGGREFRLCLLTITLHSPDALRYVSFTMFDLFVVIQRLSSSPAPSSAARS